MRMISAVRWTLLGLVLLSMSAAAFGQIGIAISFAPPALPVYEQPPCPEDGYIWTPGYWAYDYDDADYYWVPGTWIMAPEVGFLWTPPYWGWNGTGFVFYDGYWGPQVGFYGGINYGFGYFGEGFEGGRWDNGHFFYNRSVSNINITNIHNVYNTTVINRTVVNRVSYNGGNGGINARPTPQQEAVARERHIAPVSAQTQQMQEARSNRELRASANQGKPPIAATPKAGDFKDRGIVPAREAGAPYSRPNNAGNRAENNAGNRGENNARPNNGENNGNRPNNNVYHPKELPAYERPPAPNTGNAKQDQKYRQQQDKLVAKQNQEREKLQAQQERDHQKFAKQQADDSRKQQVEQRHQQQTQQLQQRHSQQMQQLQQRQQPPANRNESRPPRKQ